jgi:hypothetical protein
MRSRIIILALLAGLLAVGAQGYETTPPKYLNAEVTWRDAATGQEHSQQGQLWFANLPVKDERGKIVGFGRPGHYEGIKWFTPKNPGDIWLSRVPGTNDSNVFLLHDYCGERLIHLAFHEIGIARTANAKLDKLMEQSVSSVAAGQKNSSTGAGSKYITPEIDEISGEAPMMTAPMTATINSGDKGTAL